MHESFLPSLAVSRKFTATLMLLLSVGLPAAVQAVGPFSASNDFSTSNPSGQWTYGTETSLGAGFVAFTNHGTATSSSAVSIPIWEFSTTGAIQPIIDNNGTSGDLDFSNANDTITIPAHTIGISPSSQAGTPQYADLRFTAPISGTYALTGYWEGLDQAKTGSPPTTTTDAHILVNGFDAPARDTTINSYLTQLSFGTVGSPLLIPVSAGENIDFVVGFGGNSDAKDTTGLVLNIAVPEPASLCVLALSGTLLVTGRRRLPR